MLMIPMLLLSGSVCRRALAKLELNLNYTTTTIWALASLATFFSKSVSNSPNDYNSKFVLLNAPLWGTKFFLANTKNLKLGWCRS
jgi:hypothetical protein